MIEDTFCLAPFIPRGLNRPSERYWHIPNIGDHIAKPTDIRHRICRTIGINPPRERCGRYVLLYHTDLIPDMKGSMGKILAIAAVLALMVPVSAAIFTDTEDSSAESVDYSKFYYDQLTTDYAKNLYNEIKNATFSGGVSPTVSINLTSSDKADPRTTEKFISEESERAVTALRNDAPMSSYYFRSWNNLFTSDNCQTTLNLTDDYKGKSSLEYKADMEDGITRAKSAIDSTGTTYTTIKNIHDYVTKVLEYNDSIPSSDTESLRVRSVECALRGTEASPSPVVCEGYAKLFKVLCDAYDIPCTIVTGDAMTYSGGESTREGHMWNNVYIDGVPYILDCTWDDQTTTIYNFFLVGSETSDEQPSPHTMAELYVKENDPLFRWDTISSVRYTEGLEQYKVTYKVGSSTYLSQYVVKNGYATQPDDPPLESYQTLQYWYVSDPSVAFNFIGTPITGDITLNAKITEEETYKLTYDANGGSFGSASTMTVKVAKSSPNVTISSASPTKDGSSYHGWSTSKDGKGLTYAAGDTITLMGDMTLYASWNADPGAVDRTIGGIAEFFSEQLITGIDNGVLTMIVLVTVISLIGALLIARK